MSKLTKIQKELSRVEEMLNTLSWTSAECQDQELGRHMDAVRQYIENATGRLSMASHRINSMDKIYTVRFYCQGTWVDISGEYNSVEGALEGARKMLKEGTPVHVFEESSEECVSNTVL